MAMTKRVNLRVRLSVRVWSSVYAHIAIHALVGLMLLSIALDASQVPLNSLKFGLWSLWFYLLVAFFHKTAHRCNQWCAIPTKNPLYVPLMAAVVVIMTAIMTLLRAG